MKKKFQVLSLLLALIMVITACQGQTQNQSNKKVVTVSATFIYDMVKQIAGDKVDINIIVPAGQDPHTYQAKPDDIKKIDDADLILYIGLNFEAQMVDALAKGVKVSKKFARNELIGDDEASLDPHFWFDLKLYAQAMEVVEEELSKLLPEEKDSFKKNLEDYKKKLVELDGYISEQINLVPVETRFLITPHDAFSYFAREYDLQVHAPQGISTESEVSGQDITETVNVIVDNKVKAIFAESTTDPARMEKLKEAVQAKGFEVKVVSGTGKELHSDSLEAPGEALDSFLAMYKHNVDLIVENLK